MAIKSGQITEAPVIYALTDPVSGEVRYVGKAENAARRLILHMADCNRETTHKANWLRGLKSRGLRPGLVVLEVVDGDWAEAERRWIAHFREQGARLTNLTDGGDGCDGWVAPADTRERMSAAAQARCADPAERRRLRLITNGRPPVRRGEANNKAKVTEEQVREIRRLAAAGFTSGQIAPRFGLTYQNVWLIASRRTWKDVA